MTEPMLAFNPRLRIELQQFGNGRACLVVDDALLDPDRIVAFAAERAADFRSVEFNAYPGVLLPSPMPFNVALNDFFSQHARSHFDARRVLEMHSRLALVTLPPARLRPYQWVCHRDNQALQPQQSIQASVLYLFHDSLLGGTSFYEPAHSEQEAALLFHHASTLSAEEFAARYGIEPGYQCGSNAWFRRIGSVAAKWNRLIFYDGALLHSGDIAAPEKLSTDPRAGRLTLNGFFTSRRRAA